MRGYVTGRRGAGGARARRRRRHSTQRSQLSQRITLTNKLKQCSLTMNKIAYIALNKTLKYNLTVTFSSTFQ